MHFWRKFYNFYAGMYCRKWRVEARTHNTKYEKKNIVLVQHHRSVLLYLNRYSKSSKLRPPPTKYVLEHPGSDWWAVSKTPGKSGTLAATMDSLVLFLALSNCSSRVVTKHIIARRCQAWTMKHYRLKSQIIIFIFCYSSFWTDVFIWDFRYIEYFRLIFLLIV